VAGKPSLDIPPGTLNAIRPCLVCSGAVAIGAPSAPSSSQCRYGKRRVRGARWSPHGPSPSLRIARLSPRIASKQVSKLGVEKANWVSLLSDAIAPREVEAGLRAVAGQNLQVVVTQTRSLRSNWP
jgi:hypothetical protein